MRLALIWISCLFSSSTSHLLPSHLQNEILNKRQAPIASLQPVKYTEVESDVRKGAKKVSVSYGPFRIPPSKAGAVGMGGHAHGASPVMSAPQSPGAKQSARPMDPNGYQIRNLLSSGFCSNCTILRARALVTEKSGAAMGIGNGVYLHHIVLSPRPQKTIADPWGSCKEVNPQPSAVPAGFRPASLNSFLIVQGVENFTTWYTTPDGTFNSGFQLPADKTGQVLTGEFVNYKNATQDVYLTMEYDYVPGIVGGDAFMSLLSVLGCSLTAGPSAGGLGFQVEQGKSVKSSRNFEIQYDGTIINTRAHMHDGGDRVKLYINGKTICESVASYGGNEQATMIGPDGKKWETLSSMSECTKPTRVKQGDLLRMDAYYDTDAHPLRSTGEIEAEEMGIYFFTFVPDKKT